uniref:Uncharacterized protein n=1 Tax=Arundo donax TaxID=35708 RepID=A0A0A9HJK8_ARUDO
MWECAYSRDSSTCNAYHGGSTEGNVLREHHSKRRKEEWIATGGTRRSGTMVSWSSRSPFSRPLVHNRSTVTSLKGIELIQSC